MPYAFRRILDFKRIALALEHLGVVIFAQDMVARLLSSSPYTVCPIVVPGHAVIFYVHEFP